MPQNQFRLDPTPLVPSTGRKVTDSDFAYANGKTPDPSFDKSYNFMCEPGLDKVVFYVVLVVHETVHPERKGMVLGIPGLVNVYTT